ncbi:DUF2974 domain-containing protein [bacterium]|nr:DUF2974 domain-containing protein [bacterium]
MSKVFNLKTEMNVYNDRTIEKDLLMQKFALGVYSDEKNRTQLPDGWQSFAHSDDRTNGFYGEAYVKNGQVVVAFRGTNNKDDYNADYDVIRKVVPDQVRSALSFYQHVETLCEKYGYDKDSIILTGHSLGGIETQIVCAVTGREGVTFNAHGAKDIMERSLVRSKHIKTNVRNYGNVNDATFYTNMHNFIGKTFVIDTNPKEEMVRLRKYHRIEDMGDIRVAEPYDMSKHHKFEKENMHPDRILVMEEEMKRPRRNILNDAYAHYVHQQALKGNILWQKDIDKKVSSGEVYVHSYTKSNGTHVREYYRSYPNRK